MQILNCVMAVLVQNVLGSGIEHIDAYNIKGIKIIQPKANILTYTQGLMSDLLPNEGW